MFNLILYTTQRKYKPDLNYKLISIQLVLWSSGRVEGPGFDPHVQPKTFYHTLKHGA